MYICTYSDFSILVFLLDSPNTVGNKPAVSPILFLEFASHCLVNRIDINKVDAVLAQTLGVVVSALCLKPLHVLPLFLARIGRRVRFLQPVPAALASDVLGHVVAHARQTPKVLPLEGSRPKTFM